MAEEVNFTPQPGFQYKFLSTPVDIALGGGAAGAGKSWALLVEAARPVLYRLDGKGDYKNYAGIIFRRTYPEIENPGGLWDESELIYPYIGGRGIKSNLEWHFSDPKTGLANYAKVVFRHIQREEDKILYQGAQIPFIGFDELTHFTKDQFLYLLSRNRSMSGYASRIRATCNPDADSWVAEMIAWYIGEDGYIIKERDGQVRYFTVYNDDFIWGSTKQEVYKQTVPKWRGMTPEEIAMNIKSFTFIEGDIHDNKKLLQKDPYYLGNLMALREEDQMRLLKKNWKIKVEKDIIISHKKFADIFTNVWVKPGMRYITCDIATTGRNLFVAWVWSGKIAIDIDICESNTGKEAIDMMMHLARKHGVPNSNIIYDADGAGAGLSGWISNCTEFRANHAPLGKTNYKNLKSQCCFELAHCINQTFEKGPKDAYFIHPDVADKIYPFRSPKIYRDRSIRWILEHQMKAIRKDDKIDRDLKLSIIPKGEMKAILGSDISPDFIESMMMREFGELVNQRLNVIS